MSGPSSTGPNGQALLTAPVPLNQNGIVEFALCVVLMIIATLAVILRLWARKVKGASFAPDDYVIVVALIFLYGNGIAECVGVALGGRGHHMNELSPDVVTISLKALFVAELSWTFSTSAIKISLLLLYIRVFPQKSFRLTAYALMGVVALYCVGCMISYLGNCRPIQANWIPMLPGSTCGNQQASWLGTGIANVLTDVAILSLPMRSVYHLQLPSRTKVAVAGIFGIGFLTVAVSIARLVSLFRINVADFTYDSVPADILSAFEPTLMITCSCMPLMRPLFKSLFPSNSRLRYGRSPNKDRGSFHVSNILGGRNVNTASVHMKQLKSDKSSNKRKSVLMPSQDGFERLSDLESKSNLNVGGAHVGISEIAADKSRTASPALAWRREQQVKTPSPPESGIEVTREWTVEHHSQKE